MENCSVQFWLHVWPTKMQAWVYNWVGITLFNLVGNLELFSLSCPFERLDMQISWKNRKHAFQCNIWELAQDKLAFSWQLITCKARRHFNSYLTMYYLISSFPRHRGNVCVLYPVPIKASLNTHLLSCSRNIRGSFTFYRNKNWNYWLAVSSRAALLNCFASKLEKLQKAENPP